MLEIKLIMLTPKHSYALYINTSKVKGSIHKIYRKKKKDTPSKTHEQKHQPGLQQIIDPSKPVYAGAKAELLDKCNNQHIHKRDT